MKNEEETNSETNNNSKDIITMHENGDIEFKGKRKSVVISPKNTVFIKSWGVCLFFKILNNPIKSSIRSCMVEVKPLLNRKKFISTHISFVASMDFMVCYFAYNNGLLLLLADDEIIPVSPSMKKAFKRRVKSIYRIKELIASDEEHLIQINEIVNN